MVLSEGGTTSGSWDEVVTDLQQNLMYDFGSSDWDCYQFGQRNFLQAKVGYALYGPPQDLPSANTANTTGYEQKQWENINRILHLIIKEDAHEREKPLETWMAMIFVCIPIPGDNGDKPNVATVPVFKVPKYTRRDTESVWYIDSHARVYVNWKDYLDNNLLPACRYCYPKDGIYQANSQGRVKVEFGETPASSASQATLSTLDKVSTVAAVGSTIVGLASLAIPIAGPILAATMFAGSAVGTYGAARSGAALIDRARHGQTIDVTDPEARNCWISLAGSVVGAASTTAVNSVRSMASAGQNVSNAVRVTTTALSIGSLAINGIGLVNTGFMLHEKYNDNTLTPLDVFQFTASVFFFTHSAVNMRTATTIISETQNDVIKTYQESLRSNRHRKAFNRVARDTQQNMNGMEGKAKIIRAIRNIHNKDDFFAGVVRVQKDIHKTESTVQFTEMGQVQINQKVTIDPMEFSNIKRAQRNVILKASKDLAAGTLSQRKFNRVVKPIFRHNNISTTSHQRQAISNISGIMHSNAMESRDQKRTEMFSCNPQELYQIMRKYDPNLHQHLLLVAKNVCLRMGWETAHDFLDTLGYVCSFVEETAARVEDDYNCQLENAKRAYGSEFNQKEFDEKYGIKGKAFVHFCSLVLNHLNTDSEFKESLDRSIKHARNMYGNCKEAPTASQQQPVTEENGSEIPESRVMRADSSDELSVKLQSTIMRDECRAGKYSEMPCENTSPCDSVISYMENDPLVKFRECWEKKDAEFKERLDGSRKHARNTYGNCKEALTASQQHVTEENRSEVAESRVTRAGSSENSSDELSVKLQSMIMRDECRTAKYSEMPCEKTSLPGSVISYEENDPLVKCSVCCEQKESRSKKEAEKIKSLEECEEQRAKQVRRNNIIIKGMEVTAENNNKREVDEKAKEIVAMVDAEVETENIVFIGRDKNNREIVRVTFKNFADKLRIVKKKSVLKGKDIYIEDDLTKTEREIQAALRKRAWEERRKGNNDVKVGYQKIRINGHWINWKDLHTKKLNVDNQEVNSAKQTLCHVNRIRTNTHHLKCKISENGRKKKRNSAVH